MVYSIRETQHNSEQNGMTGTEFDPDRWRSIKDNQQVVPVPSSEPNFEYVPFGWGERSCVGQKYAEVVLKILMIELVRNAKWKLVNGKPDILYMPVPHPKDNLPLQFKPMSPDLRRRAFTLSW